jgi:hypothetical protein
MKAYCKFPCGYEYLFQTFWLVDLIKDPHANYPQTCPVHENRCK